MTSRPSTRVHGDQGPPGAPCRVCEMLPSAAIPSTSMRPYALVSAARLLKRPPNCAHADQVPAAVTCHRWYAEPLVATPNTSSRPSALRAIATCDPPSGPAPVATMPAGTGAAGAAGARGATATPRPPPAAAIVVIRRKPIPRMMLPCVSRRTGAERRRAGLEFGIPRRDRCRSQRGGAHPTVAPRPGDALPAGGGVRR